MAPCPTPTPQPSNRISCHRRQCTFTFCLGCCRCLSPPLSLRLDFALAFCSLDRCVTIPHAALAWLRLPGEEPARHAVCLRHLSSLLARALSLISGDFGSLFSHHRRYDAPTTGVVQPPPPQLQQQPHQLPSPPAAAAAYPTTAIVSPSAPPTPGAGELPPAYTT
jgi:hypothetical protein